MVCGEVISAAWEIRQETGPCNLESSNGARKENNEEIGHQRIRDIESPFILLDLKEAGL